MKYLRIVAIVPLALISLMNVGYAFGTDPDVALAVAALVLGAAGFVAAFGLGRNTRWGIPAALAISGINVVAAIIALANDTDGAIVGMVISALALAMAFVASSGSRITSQA